MPLRLPSRGDVALLAAVVVVGALLAYTTAASPQVALTVVLVAVAAGVHFVDRRAAVVVVYLTWLLAPGIRRVLAPNGAVELDPLSIAPYLLTLIVAAMEWRRGLPAPVVRRMTALVVAGWLVGLPVGLAVDPQAAVYNLFAYTSAVAALTLGATERARGFGDLVVIRLMLIVLPVLAVYGAAQSIVGLTPWDAAWLRSIDLITFYAPDGNGVRVFGTLNAPGVFAPLLALGILSYVARRRTGPWLLVVAAVVATALALTYVRAAWIALAVALVVFALAAGGSARIRVFGLIALVVVAVVALAPSNPSAAAILDRFDTVHSLSDDTSANDRNAAVQRLLPESLRLPLGHGTGTTGEAARFSSSALRAPDNGYLALIYQTGPLGFLLVMGGLLAAMAHAARRALRWRVSRDFHDGAFVLATIAFLLVFLASGDHFYGVIGAVMWYLLGAAVSPQGAWRAERPPSERQPQAVADPAVTAGP